MKSLRELYRIGTGPSSSHTMAPHKAADLFLKRYPEGVQFCVTLYGSLAATGKGHQTDRAIQSAFSPHPVEIKWQPEKQLPYHPNGMCFEVLDSENKLIDSWIVYSIGGGALQDDRGSFASPQVYKITTLQGVINYCQETGQSFWEYVEESEGKGIWDYLHEVWENMEATIERGLHAEGVLPGGLGVARKGWSMHRKAIAANGHLKRAGYLSAYALAVAEENAAGGIIVTAPTCGSCGVLPAVIKYLKDSLALNEQSILHGLATAGLIGNLIKRNASISGAEVGCQGEIGAACAMAAAAATQLLGGSIRQIEYAAETGLEHHLGLTCDPVAGLVQIPCIERNAFAAMRALSCADYALLTDGYHRVSFDTIVNVMRQTGHDLPSLYRETSEGGLATAYLNFNPKSGRS